MGVKGGVSGAVDGVKGSVGGAVDGVKGSVGGAVDGISGAVKGVGGNIGAAGVGALAGAGALAAGARGMLRGEVPSGFAAGDKVKGAIVLHENDTLAAARGLIAQHGGDSVFVVNDNQELQGIVDINRISAQADDLRIGNHMTKVLPASVDSGIDDIRALFKMQKVPMLVPLIDAAKRVVGALDPKDFS